jgi:hypothetical protein
MSALDDFLAEIRADPEYPGLARLNLEPDATIDELVGAVTKLFEILQTSDQSIAVHVHDQAVQIARRTDLDVTERVKWLGRFVQGVVANASKGRLQ